MAVNASLNSISLGKHPPSRSSLFHHVMNILTLCPNEQMLGIAAQGNIAMMADHQADRDWAIRLFPCQTMHEAIGII
jgi:hypothetical protein